MRDMITKQEKGSMAPENKHREEDTIMPRNKMPTFSISFFQKTATRLITQCDSFLWRDLLRTDCLHFLPSLTL